MPWKNGGGVAYEIAREPHGTAIFAWRLSLALIERGGPFSDFTGYRRALTFIGGAGCILTGIDAVPLRLDRPGTTTQFPGSAAVSCELIDGSCWDLNLMVREPGEIAIARSVSLQSRSSHELLARYDNALFCIDGTAECINRAGERVALARHDTFIVGAAAAADWRVESGGDDNAQLAAYAWRRA